MKNQLLKTVKRVQARLLRSAQPQKLLKTLKRLEELPMTVDILAETGVGKAVNSFRKHEVVGQVAKSLVAKWKQLLRKTAHRAANSHARKSHSSKADGTRSTKRPSSSQSPAAAPPRKRRTVVEAVPTLPEVPVQVTTPNLRPLASIDVTLMSHQGQEGPVCNSEVAAVFTGERIHSRTLVYSGSKTSSLPRMVTLQNHIDSITELGGVSYEIVKPELERCTPEQLHHIEQSNQWIKEDSDELWKRHCLREFERESPQECESWREMYPRLHEEREERLRLLTKKISSAHVNKSKGRQVKMAFMTSDAKPPRDVRR